MAGSWKPALGRYVICIGGGRYQAHRIVYYLRTGTDPGQDVVIHKADNPDRDNRKELVLQKRKKAEQTEPKYKRRPQPEKNQSW